MQGNEANSVRDMWPKGDMISGMSLFSSAKEQNTGF